MKDINSQLPRGQCPGRQLPKFVGVVLLLLMGGCSSPSTTSSAAPEMLEVTLPDLSRMDVNVQAQVRERYQSMLDTIKRPGATSEERGQAYGSIGMVLHAGEYYAAAKPAYLNQRISDMVVIRPVYPDMHGIGASEQRIGFPITTHIEV